MTARQCLSELGVLELAVQGCCHQKDCISGPRPRGLHHADYGPVITVVKYRRITFLLIKCSLIFCIGVPNFDRMDDKVLRHQGVQFCYWKEPWVDRVKDAGHIREFARECNCCDLTTPCTVYFPANPNSNCVAIPPVRLNKCG